MLYRAIRLVGILSSACLVLTAQQPTSSGIYTAAQAEAGPVAYERTCGQCHTGTLMGRKGDPGELPPISSLSASWQKFIGPRGFVALLAGKVFLDRWGDKTAAELIARFQETVDDPYLKFEGMDDKTTVNITAYVLQVNGAKAGTEPLTRTTGVIVSSVTRRAADNAGLAIAQDGATFEVASVKINRSSDRPRISIQPESGTVTITAMTVQEVILTAYKLQPFYLVTINSPALKQRVDITAKATSSAANASTPPRREIQSQSSPRDS